MDQAAMPCRGQSGLHWLDVQRAKEENDGGGEKKKETERASRSLCSVPHRCHASH